MCEHLRRNSALIARFVSTVTCVNTRIWELGERRFCEHGSVFAKVVPDTGSLERASPGSHIRIGSTSFQNRDDPVRVRVKPQTGKSECVECGQSCCCCSCRSRRLNSERRRSLVLHLSPGGRARRISRRPGAGRRGWRTMARTRRCGTTRRISETDPRLEHDIWNTERQAAQRDVRGPVHPGTDRGRGPASDGRRGTLTL